jgi:hypothetical protein
MTETTVERKRERDTGRFAHSADAVCRCGHGLDVHAAETVGGKRPCFAGDFGGEFCECERFRKVN